MADPARARKLAERISQIVARLLETRVKDPRLGFVTITDARVTGDLQHATVYYTVLGDQEARDETAAALASATGMIRSEVGKQTGVRLTPTITFVADTVPEVAAALEESLRAAAAHDAAVAELARNATYAGDADPYRKAPAVEPESGDPPAAAPAPDLADPGVLAAAVHAAEGDGGFDHASDGELDQFDAGGEGEFDAAADGELDGFDESAR